MLELYRQLEAQQAQLKAGMRTALLAMEAAEFEEHSELPR